MSRRLPPSALIALAFAALGERLHAGEPIDGRAYLEPDRGPLAVHTSTTSARNARRLARKAERRARR